MKEQQDSDYSFLQEKIKERPINRRKLIRTSLNTAVFAVVFGLVACVVFILLEPVIGKILSPEEEEVRNPIVLPTEQEEMLPEDMVLDEEALSESQSEAPSTNISSAVSTIELGVTDYQQLYDKMRTVAKEAEKSVVKVTGMHEDVNWFQNRMERTNETSGLIFADNGLELMVLCDQEAISNATDIVVTFCNGTKSPAVMKKVDSNTGFAVLAVELENVTENTREAISYARIGSSASTSIVGNLVIAVGSPLGYSDSLCYGMITSNRNPVSLVDANYTLVTTDIYGSQNASGVLINTLGQVIGIICQDYNNADMKNQISAIGITEFKKTMEDLSNEKDAALLGVYVTDVTQEAQTTLSVPDGAYVTDVMLHSPAMENGIRKGDIIVAVGDVVVTGVSDYLEELSDYAPEDEVNISIMRAGVDGYQEMDIKVVLASRK